MDRYLLFTSIALWIKNPLVLTFLDNVFTYLYFIWSERMSTESLTIILGTNWIIPADWIVVNQFPVQLFRTRWVYNIIDQLPIYLFLVIPHFRCDLSAIKYSFGNCLISTKWYVGHRIDFPWNYRQPLSGQSMSSKLVIAQQINWGLSPVAVQP